MCRMGSWRPAAVAALAACMLHSTATLPAAQQPTSPSDELTAAILRYSFRYEGGNARVLQARVPDDLAPNLYVPRGTKVLGSVVTGSAVLVLATTTAPPESLRAEYARALAPRGWQPFEGMRRGGFIDNPAHVPLIFCRDGAQLHIVHSRRASGSSDLYLHYRESPGPCDQPRAVAFRGMSEPNFPTLYAPSGTPNDSRMRCHALTGGRRGSTGTSTMVPATMAADEVLRHYSRQIEADGWRPAAGRDGTVATGAWTRPDSNGTRELLLHVREVGPSGARCFEVEMRVSNDGVR
jgi:hypothetical protein